jgi:hypothetical protein
VHTILLPDERMGPVHHGPVHPHLLWGGRDPHTILMEMAKQIADNTVEIGQVLAEVNARLDRLENAK